ncbi:Transcription initiation factor TFIID subunit 9B [Apophysomyces sp. BC1034]|nr:Transcription initiation factor TFIID subunit 9B [Apophysomyces sp. BC1015]KAG0181973.1 Transcription initiation factor TFIID subunit 9B [Apophysomyces sp. BC1021]KAG0193009.1 Transcription initiation factor TFIID subunit 9B [Apophysomyces sp. BC1034]
MAIDSQTYQKQQPHDARIISLILQSLGVEDYDPKVVHQLLEFSHRYTTDVFQDALIYGEHANKSDLDLEDIQLAIQGRVNHSFTTPPPKEFLLELAQEKNKAPLPLIPEKYGIRLPAEKYCLTGLNFAIVPDAPPPPRPILDKPQMYLQTSSPTTYSQDASRNDLEFDIVSQTQPAPFSALPQQPQQQQQQQMKRGRDMMEDDEYDF